MCSGKEEDKQNHLLTSAVQKMKYICFLRMCLDDSVSTGWYNYGNFFFSFPI